MNDFNSNRILVEDPKEIENSDSVENENTGDEDAQNEIVKPFDPDKIDVNIETVNLGYLIDMLENEEIDLQPDFQRASDLWSPEKKSRLIESILLGLPLPSFYFSENTEIKKLSIIDGLQRLCAIKSFILTKDKPLRLSKLQFLTKFNDKTYDELGRPEVKRIRGLKITMNTLRKETPDDVKFVIFQRVNTSGIPLTPQEMRHALNQGKASKFVKELAESPSFIKATNGSVKIDRMQDRDFINRFIAFYIFSYTAYKGELDTFLNDAMIELKNKKDLDKIKNTFETSMNICFDIFGRDAFRKRYDISDARKPISKSVFDTVSVNIALLNESEQKILVTKKRIFKQELIGLFNDADFYTAITSGTGKKTSVEIRFKKMEKLIQKIIHENQSN